MFSGNVSKKRPAEQARVAAKENSGTLKRRVSSFSSLLRDRRRLLFTSELCKVREVVKFDKIFFSLVFFSLDETSVVLLTSK